MNALVDFGRTLQRAPVFLACVALFILMVMTFCDVIFRSVFNAPIEAATELTRILMAIMVFSVLPVVSGHGSHISVDLTDPWFDYMRLYNIRDGLVSLASGLMLWWPVQRVWALAERARDYGDVTEYLSIPTYLIGWFIAASTAVTAIVLILTGILYFVAPKLLENRT